MKFLTFCSKPPATAVTTVTTTTTTTTADGAATAGSADMTVAPGSAAAAAAAATEDDGLALPFGEYLASKWGFKEETSKFIIFAIAGKTASDVASECTEAIRRYFVSIGVYGNFDMGVDRFAHVLPPNRPAHAVRCALRWAHVYRMPIGACNPML